MTEDQIWIERDNLVDSTVDTGATLIIIEQTDGTRLAGDVFLNLALPSAWIFHDGKLWFKGLEMPEVLQAINELESESLLTDFFRPV